MQEAFDPNVPEDPRNIEEPKPAPLLDLDALEVVNLPVTLNGVVYYMKNKADMAMADREELRLCLMQIADLQEAEPGKDGRHTTGHRKALDDLEKRLVSLALPDLPRKILENEKEMTAARRNAIVERFFIEVDVMETVQSFVATMRRMNQKSRQTQNAAQPNLQLMNKTGVTPPLPPVDLLGRRPSSTTTPNEIST